jgi:abhydrolase domain-containing protein 14
VEVEPGELLAHLVASLGSSRPPVVVAPSMSGRYALAALVKDPGLFGGFVAVAPVGIDDLDDASPPIELPALILWGEDDRVIPVEKADRLAERFLASEKHVLAGAGHPCYLDRTEEFHRILGEFLERVDR